MYNNKPSDRTKDQGLKGMPLYGRPMRSTRSGPLFNAFPYPTKISPEAIALFIATHTKPGATVFDGFAGSGSTGVAAILCDNPTDEMKREADRLGLSVCWGPRRAVLYEIGVLGSFVSKVLCSPPDPDDFSIAANQLLNDVEQQLSWLYKTSDPVGEQGIIRHIIWADMLHCPSCRKHTSLWDACASRNPAEISRSFTCPFCGTNTDMADVKRVRESVTDDLLGSKRKTRRRAPAWVYGKTNGRFWSRRADNSDLRIIKRINKVPIPVDAPQLAIPWGDLYRAGYHEGISHLHHLYTRRNFIAFASLWSEVDKYPTHLQDALRFWLLSYNASHSTIMTRVVAKKGQEDLVVTSAQPGVLYVSGLPVEKNVFAGVQRKLGTICRAFELTHRRESLVEVRNASSLKVELPDKTIDYMFTDPPFGGNIPYSEVNFINEAWLRRTTDSTEEAIISPHQGKTVDNYQDLMVKAFQEAHRILRPEANATVAFHSTSARVWNALRDACEQAGFYVADTSVLDKTQSSFKQVKSPGAVKGDPLILLSKKYSGKNGSLTDIWAIVDNLLAEAQHSGDSVEASPQRLYSRLVGHYLSNSRDVPINARDFYRQLQERQVARENKACGHSHPAARSQGS